MNTPFGEIIVLLDDEPIENTAIEKEKNDIFKDVLGCYRIVVDIQPDGKSHEIKCVIPDIQCNNRCSETGEDIECQSFFNEKGDKLSICVQAEIGYLPDGSRWSEKYDYDAAYLENGMSYKILETTRESRFVFGLAWIDQVVDEDGEWNLERENQTWFAADFTLD